MAFAAGLAGSFAFLGTGNRLVVVVDRRQDSRCGQAWWVRRLLAMVGGRVSCALCELQRVFASCGSADISAHTRRGLALASSCMVTSSLDYTCTHSFTHWLQ
jgi:hypothetical protein